MIDRIDGKIIEIKLDYVVISLGGMGFAVYLPSLSMGKLNKDDIVTIYTHLQVREDAFTLYGFLNEEDRALFHLLIGVTGVGPKVAIGILSKFSSSDMLRFIQMEDVKSLTQAPGIGKKTAERLILELKDKVKQIDDSITSEQIEAPLIVGAKEEALDALIGLGYSNSESLAALKGLEGNVEVLLKSALKRLSTNR